jgi:hypothetical protein
MDEAHERLAAARRERIQKEEDRRIATLLSNVRTVGDLMDRIATLPRDMPVHRVGSCGDFPEGGEMRIATLAEHINEAGFFGDMADRVWAKSGKRGFGREFKALVVD